MKKFSSRILSGVMVGLMILSCMSVSAFSMENTYFEDFEYENIDSQWFVAQQNLKALDYFKTTAEQKVSGEKSLAVTYDFSKCQAGDQQSVILSSRQYADGGKLMSEPKEGYKISSFSFWVYGDMSNDALVFTINSVRYVEIVNFSGWKQITIPLDITTAARLYSFEIYNEVQTNNVQTTMYFDGFSVGFERNLPKFKEVGDDFERSTGWFLNNNVYTANGGSLAVQNSSKDQKKNGASSLKLDYSLKYTEDRPTFFDVIAGEYGNGGLPMPYVDGKTIDYIGAWIFGTNSGILTQLIVNNGKDRAFVATPYLKKGDITPLKENWNGWRYVKFYPNNYTGTLKFQPRIYQICLEAAKADSGIKSGQMYMDDLTIHYLDEENFDAFKASNFTKESIATTEVADNFETVNNWKFRLDEWAQNGCSLDLKRSNEQPKNQKSSLAVSYNYAYTDINRNGYMDILANAWETNGYLLPLSAGRAMQNIGMWIYGDDSKSDIQLVVNQASDPTIQTVWSMMDKVGGTKQFMDWNGWKYVTFYPENDSVAKFNPNEAQKLFKICFTGFSQYGNKSGTVYIDDISVGYTVDTTNVPVLSPVTTQLYPTTSELANSFESYDWFIQDDSYGKNGCTMTGSISSDIKKNGLNSYKLAYNYKFDRPSDAYINIFPNDFNNGYTLPYQSGKYIKSIGMWLYGDGNGSDIQLVVKEKNNLDNRTVWSMMDKVGGTKQFVDWSGWKYVTFYPESATLYPYSEQLVLGQFAITAFNSKGVKSGAMYWDDLQVDYADASIGLDYDLTTKNISDIHAVKQDAMAIPKQGFRPCGVGLYIYGDNSKNDVCMTFSDSFKNEMQSNKIKLDFTGWKYCSFSIDGGLNLPAYLKSVNIIKGSESTTGSVYLSNAQILYTIQQAPYCSIENNSTVNCATQNVDLYFTAEVNENTLSQSSIAVTADGTPISNYVVKEISPNNFKIIFSGYLKGNTKYSISVNDTVTDIFNQSCAFNVNFMTTDDQVTNTRYALNNKDIANSSDINNGTLNVYCDYKNLNGFENVTFMTVVYDKNNKVVALGTDACTGIISNNVYTANMPLELTNINSLEKYTVKTFLMENLDTIKPINSAIKMITK